MLWYRPIPHGVALAALLASTALAAPDPAAVDYFEQHVRPVFAEHCMDCHDAGSRKGGLRLDAHAGVLAGGDLGPILDLANPEASRLLQTVGHEGKTKMPPKGKLPQETIDHIANWIRMGAPWPEEADVAADEPKPFAEFVAEARQRHWAFQPVPRPAEAVAAQPAPAAIDQLVSGRLAEAGLALSPEADRRTLIRRAHFDLLGLPPAPEAVAAFESDPAPDAYARLVEDLLASPHYGERWGRHWLDVARYADTKGYVFQEERDFPYSHTYRDFVIRAFNEDLPYDQFVRYQLAADQMDLGEDPRPLAAMGFLTLGRRFINNVHDITDDRIDVVTRGLMGLTVSCARCHDHKYDPISAADYYALYGVFRSSVEPPEYPLLQEPDPENPQYQDYLAQVADREAKVEQVLDEVHSNLLAKARDRVHDYLLAAHDTRGQDEAAVKILAGERGLLWQLVLRWRAWLEERAAAPDPVTSAWLAFAALPAEGFAAGAPALLEQVRAGTSPLGPVNARVAKAFESRGVDGMGDVARAYRRVIKEADEAWAALLVTRAQAAALGGAATMALPEALPDGDLEAVRQSLLGPASPGSPPREQAYDLSDVPTQGRIREARNAVARVKNTHPGRPDRAMSLRDADTLFDPYVFLRGKPENKGETVPRRFLSVFSDLREAPFERGSGRLELAEAIANPANPLTARVLVNRVWQQHFGRGLVETASDFGLRSDPPSHPDLLDYLAWRFVEDGWSLKSLHRAILLSQVYRQASEARPEAAAVDPENRLLWRQNRQRLDFEAARDALLAAAGTLDPAMGGPAVDITQAPYPTRRTVYSFIERQNLPAMFRTFDFASPDTHSPKRLDTTVPQQALFMMNNPFVLEQSRRLAARADADAPADVRVARLYHLAYQRPPSLGETERALRFLDEALGAPPPGVPWRYGYATWNPGAQQPGDFTPLPHFSDGGWKGGETLPDAALGWVSLRKGGGHPGNPERAAVLRWESPAHAVLRVRGTLGHGSDQGDGVQGIIHAPGKGVLWQGTAHNGEAAAAVDGIAVAPGDIVDFIVHCGANESHDGFSWSPVIELYAGADAEAPYDTHDAARDFGGPPPPPLTPWEMLAHTLVMTNEFAFVD
jgi:hypothetical protein